MNVSMKLVKATLSRFLDSFDSGADSILSCLINGSIDCDEARRRLDIRFYLFNGRMCGIDSLLWLVHSDIQDIVSSNRDSLKARFDYYYDRISKMAIQRIVDSSYSPIFGADTEAVETVLLPPEKSDSEQPVEAVVSLKECPVCLGVGYPESSDFSPCNNCSGSGFISSDVEILPFSSFPSTSAGSKRHYFRNITFMPGYVKRHSLSAFNRLTFRTFSNRLSKSFPLYDKSKELRHV
ncbi:hypothetical protein [Methylomonas rivi]|uniref:Uncharacterized protein n=1 Tax=Methylomonas rivi TaxID=2952226 RepID=A0ABT1U9L4_9GAMM|nr:hypothetical protein [Methylomonas sp. WSC-6]MCQ8130510.1 hypothetical protein [Methylomonas sp. WSC-6]